jgi:hypothetical protein
MRNWKVDTRFDTPANSSVLAFLRDTNPSAHSDVAEELLRSAEGIPGVAHYCPDSQSYAFVILHLADSTIIGMAYGQSALAYRLPHHLHAEACEQRACAAAELGPDWLRFEPWSDAEKLQESRHRLSRWCSVAAEEMSGPKGPTG